MATRSRRIRRGGKLSPPKKSLPPPETFVHREDIGVGQLFKLLFPENMGVLDGENGAKYLYERHSPGSIFYQHTSPASDSFLTSCGVYVGTERTPPMGRLFDPRLILYHRVLFGRDAVYVAVEIFKNDFVRIDDDPHA